jgi:small-conductance mechanosensitive channel/CRP-like cAMP-binding protein
VNPMTDLTAELLGYAAIFVVASAATWKLRLRCREEDIVSLDAAGTLRHVLGRMSRSLVVLALTAALAWVVRGPAGLGGWLDAHGSHLHAWMRFWELVLLIGAAEGLVVLVNRARKRPFPLPDLLLNIVRGLLIAGAFVIVLRYTLGVNVSPVLGASALVTAVVGFALQGVLGNLLAGMSLHVVRSVVPSDWVAIGDIEGEVIQTNWRETRLRTIAGHTIIVPNSTVAAATIHNMTRPTPLRRHRVFVGASYSDAPAEVLAALMASALAVPEVLREPAPSAFLTEYKDFGINYVLRFWTNRFYDRTAVEGDVMRMVWYQFKRKGIEIPFPMSDKLLNDFMEVVYDQRRKPPEETEVRRMRSDLFRSDFLSRLLADEKGTLLLKEDDLTEVARLARRVRFTRGETVFRQGDPGETCCVVVWGKVHGRVEYQDAAQANEFDLGPGSLFGEMSLVTGLPRTATILAQEEVELIEISKDAFTKLLSLREDIPQILARLVADRAVQNAVALERLKTMGAANVGETLKRENILKRFLRMLGRSK